MRHINLRQAVDAINLRVDFVAGAKTLRGFTDDDGTYKVYSYRALIAWVKPSGEAWVTDTKYSVTTSRHTGVARRGLWSALHPERVGN